jgi:hypothetical protein
METGIKDIFVAIMTEFSEINDSHQTTDPRSLENDQSNKYQKKSTQNTLISKLLKLKTRRKS